MRKATFALIGAGSASFAPATITDVLLSPPFAEVDLELRLMDIAPAALEASRRFTERLLARFGRRIALVATLDLAEAVRGADFVVVAIEKERYHYWSQDFHVPRRYGFRQVYGENGGPGGMFHFLRNAGPVLEIARAVEAHAPDAWLLNYTNPEAKLVEMLGKLSSVKAVGLCHGDRMGQHQLSKILRMDPQDIGFVACGLNHFGWYPKLWDRRTGEDLYPRLREADREADWLAEWDEFAFGRVLFRLYGLWPYPGTNHMGEYVAWSDAFLASALLQYPHDPLVDRPWETRNPPEFVYNLTGEPTSRPFFRDPAAAAPSAGDPDYLRLPAEGEPLRPSQEYGIRIAEAVFFDRPAEIGAVNVLNRGLVPNLLADMAVEVPATVDGRGVHPHRMEALPTGAAAMINVQGAIHDLLIQAFAENSKRKLLQALLVDPTVSSYANAVALVDEMFRLQGDILPPLAW